MENLFHELYINMYPIIQKVIFKKKILPELLCVRVHFFKTAVKLDVRFFSSKKAFLLIEKTDIENVRNVYTGKDIED